MHAEYTMPSKKEKAILDEQESTEREVYGAVAAHPARSGSRKTHDLYPWVGFRQVVATETSSYTVEHLAHKYTIRACMK